MHSRFKVDNIQMQMKINLRLHFQTMPTLKHVWQIQMQIV